MNRTIAIVLLTCALSLGQVSDGAAANSSPSLNKLCFVDGLKYSTVASAMNDCGGSGIVVIPPTYVGNEPVENATGIIDLRHSENAKGLTPVTELGVRNDAVTRNDGASQSGSNMFSSASASFAAGRDEGKAIVITGAGPENASLTTTIRAVKSPASVELATAAGFTATGLTYWYGTENTPALQAAYGSGKPLFLPPGQYLMTGTVKGSTPVFLIGSGAQSVIIDDTTVFDMRGKAGHLLDNFRMQAATKLTVLPPRSFPTRYTGTPVAVDRVGAGIGYQPEVQDSDVWSKLSGAQRTQQIGPTIIAKSDGTHIYGITGDLISILLYDVQLSEVALCNFRAGKNFAGAIVLWHTPHDGLANRQDSIHDNSVRYASYSGIVWTSSDKVSIRHNQSAYNGESGLKNYATQGDGTYNTHAEVVGNDSEHNQFDGMDLSESYPHINNFQASSVVSENTSSFNIRTGAYIDGLGWTLVNNVFEGNGLTGMEMDVSDSVISRNTLTHNNTLHDPRANQMILGSGRPSMNNIIEHNRIVGGSGSGAAIKWGSVSTGNKIVDNTATGGAVFMFAAPPAESQGNSDSRGRYSDR
jgi:hypothetical protein